MRHVAYADIYQRCYHVALDNVNVEQFFEFTHAPQMQIRSTTLLMCSIQKRTCGQLRN